MTKMKSSASASVGLQSVPSAELTLVHRLGGGAFGEAHLALWRGAEVAVKFTRARKSAVSSRDARAKRETRRTRRTRNTRNTRTRARRPKHSDSEDEDGEEEALGRARGFGVARELPEGGADDGRAAPPERGLRVRRGGRR